MGNFKMDWEFRSAENGNIALTGEVDLPREDEFIVAIACGGKATRARPPSCSNRWPNPSKLTVKVTCVNGSARSVNPEFDFNGAHGDGGGTVSIEPLRVAGS